MKSLFLERLHSDAPQSGSRRDRPVLVFDGAMGTNLQVQIYHLQINSLSIYS